MKKKSFRDMRSSGVSDIRIEVPRSNIGEAAAKREREAAEEAERVRAAEAKVKADADALERKIKADDLRQKEEARRAASRARATSSDTPGLVDRFASFFNGPVQVNPTLREITEELSRTPSNSGGLVTGRTVSAAPTHPEFPSFSSGRISSSQPNTQSVISSRSRTNVERLATDIESVINTTNANARTNEVERLQDALGRASINMTLNNLGNGGRARTQIVLPDSDRSPPAITQRVDTDNFRDQGTEENISYNISEAVALDQGALNSVNIYTGTARVYADNDIMRRQQVFRVELPRTYVVLSGHGTPRQVIEHARDVFNINLHERALQTAMRSARGLELIDSFSLSLGNEQRWVVVARNTNEAGTGMVLMMSRDGNSVFRNTRYTPDMPVDRAIGASIMQLKDALNGE